MNNRPDNSEANAASLFREIGWFVGVVNERLARYFNAAPALELPPAPGNAAIGQAPEVPFQTASPPDLTQDDSVYATLVKELQLGSQERLLLMLALIPEVQPQLLDVFFTANRDTGRAYTEFGGIKGTNHSGFIPTVETALFLLAGNDLAQRFRVLPLFEPEHALSMRGILQFRAGSADEPAHSSAIAVSEEYIDYITTGAARSPRFSMDFPAKRITTSMEWGDLVVDDDTAKQLDELRVFLRHGPTLFEEWGMMRRLKPGYKVLFHGPPGTGKTLTAALLGKQFGLDVYRIDLSMVISKYIGETEKNLEKVFRKAERKTWILFFDEADALFGKRTSISDAHDKYANQEVAYLLQRLEEYPGLVILASNMRNNVDEAFTRRLQSIIHFGKPQPRERLRLWKSAFSAACTPPDDASLLRLAQQHNLSGGAIMNVVQTASLMTLERGERCITTDDLVAGIKKEMRKEGKSV